MSDTDKTPTPFRQAFVDMSKSQRAQAAVLASCSVGHLRNVSNGFRTMTPLIAAAVERASAATYHVETLLPDQPWSRIKDRRYPHPGGRPVLELCASSPPA